METNTSWTRSKSEQVKGTQINTQTKKWTKPASSLFSGQPGNAGEFIARWTFFLGTCQITKESWVGHTGWICGVECVLNEEKMCGAATHGLYPSCMLPLLTQHINTRRQKPVHLRSITTEPKGQRMLYSNGATVIWRLRILLSVNLSCWHLDRQARQIRGHVETKEVLAGQAAKSEEQKGWIVLGRREDACVPTTPTEQVVVCQRPVRASRAAWPPCCGHCVCFRGTYCYEKSVITLEQQIKFAC